MNNRQLTNTFSLIADLLETRTTVIQAASGLSPTTQDTVFLGIWSVVDLIARG